MTIIALVWCILGALCTASLVLDRARPIAQRIIAAVLCVLNVGAVVLNGLVLAGVIK